MPSRRNRLAIPKVNPNPRPPNERKAGPTYTPPGSTHYTPPAGGGGGGGQGGGQGNGQNSQMSRIDKLLSKYTQQQTQDQPTPPPAPVQTPLTAQAIESSLSGGATSALGMSSFQPSAGQPDPRTPDYWRNVNNLLFNTQSTLRNLNLAGQRETLDRARAVGDMNTSRTRQQRSLGEDAMRSGLANSGWLARSEAEQGTDYLRDVEDMNVGYERSAADRKTAYSQAIQDYIAGEGEQASTALSDYFATQNAQAQEGNPMMTAQDIKRLEKILKGKGKKGGGKGPHYEPPRNRRN
jgi:hypothetical protein